MTRILFALMFLSGPAFSCGAHKETGNDIFEMKVCAAVTTYCVVGNEHTPCEDIPVFPLTEDDYSEPPTPAEQWASVEVWRKIEPSN